MTFHQPDFESVSSREWIVTNGIGGYASSSICGANTRRYHGLLVAAFNPPTDRRVLVSGIEEKIKIENQEIFISSNQYPGAIHPEGYKYLTHFTRSPLPKTYYSAPQFAINRSVFMVYGSNTSVVEYENTGINAFTLNLTPLFSRRDYHHLTHESPELEFIHKNNTPGKLKIIAHQGSSPLYMYFDDGEFKPREDWYRDREYQREAERGLDFHEDVKCIGEINFTVQPGEKKYLVFSIEESIPDGTPDTWRTFEELRLKELCTKGPGFLKDLITSGDQFLVWRLSSRSYSIIAGYHWFTDWGRDTMIAMRGLVIATGKKQIAESIFRTFIKYLDQGMIPNRFPDLGEEPEYNTLDATLWMFVALYEYAEKFNDYNFIDEIFPSLTLILEHHIKGTRYDIHVTSQGLLSGGQEKTQLTWMDAKVDDHVVTPRQGCAVEINALWYNALMIYVHLGEELKQPVTAIRERAQLTKGFFRHYFINASGYLNDVLIPGQYTDDAIRPNQIYAVSLPFSPLLENECETVLKTVEDHLYTDYGLRSLAPSHAEFKPVYRGDQWERDHAYHQGTVWAYLWGEYMLAYLKVHGYSVEAKAYVMERTKVLEHHFYHEDGIHAISEIFDGGKPGQGKGCIQQAWSVGMLLKVMLLIA
ncbi:MAG: glycogen debranching enzyme N-terminal domain-containing protein [Bacteroidota bacterium]|nr:glycogen debranching enzyme N-terminal domain-containing protein [Bacteroidota bacterium]